MSEAHNISTAATKFAQIVAQYIPAANLQSYKVEQLLDLSDRLRLSRDLIEWYRIAAPNDVWIKWTGNDLFLCDPLKLSTYQAGYRWAVGDEKTFDPTWDPNWIVFGDIGGDPLIAHVDQPHTPISFAFHGTGTWEPRQIAPSISTFLNVLSKWIPLCYGTYRKQGLFDNDFNLTPQVLTQLKAILADELGHTEQRNFFYLFWSDQSK